ncbi:MAG TPA: SulP family inorganic anion transporter, partial [Chromatiales bacterium]|nr:SulP family inorganic anion transporter [Chromatiales bacterium]
GFTNAAAIVIGTSQLSKLFGVTVEKEGYHLHTIYNVVVEAAQNIHMLTFAFAVLSIAIIWSTRKYAPKLPGVLIAVLVATLLSWVIGFEGKGGMVVGKIPAGLPGLAAPTFDWEVIKHLITSTVIISLIGFMEAISIAKALAARTRQRLDANQELVGQGLSNLVSGLSGGYAVSGSFSRSAVNMDAGAITGFSSIVTGAVVGLTLLILTPLLYHLPQATLASVIIMAVVGLVRIEPIRHAWKVEKHDGIVAVVVFVLTLAMAPDLEIGIFAGVLLAMALFIYRTMRPRIAILSRFHDGTLRDVKVHPELDRCKKILMFRWDMSLYYANAGYFETKVLQMVADHPDVEYLILDAEGINTIDSTGEEVLLHLSERLHHIGVTIIVARMKKQFMDALRKTGTLKTMGGDNRRFFSRIAFALEQAWTDMECDKCDNGRNCPLRPSVARRQAMHRGEIGKDQTKSAGLD